MCHTSSCLAGARGRPRRPAMRHRRNFRRRVCRHARRLVPAGERPRMPPRARLTTYGEAARPAGRVAIQEPGRRSMSCTSAPLMTCPPRCSRAIVCAMPALAGAQETRAASIAAEQAEKATRLGPARAALGREAAADACARRSSRSPLASIPYFDSVYSGGGFTLGAGLPPVHRRSHALERRGLVLDQELQADRGDRHLAGPRSPAASTFAARVGWRDATQVAYHGLGIDSPADADTGLPHAAGYRRRRRDRAARTGGCVLTARRRRTRTTR